MIKYKILDINQLFSRGRKWKNIVNSKRKHEAG